MASNSKTTVHRSSNKPITPDDISRARREAPSALKYYRDFGLAEARSRALNILFSGAVPLLGLIFFGWSTAAMLMFMIADAAITTIADLIRYPLAKKWITASHRIDHESSRILLICDALEDGTGERADTGNPVHPSVILFFGCVSTLFLVPIIAAAGEHIGLEPLRNIVHEPGFLWVLGIDAAWRCISGLVGAIMVRGSLPGEKMIFLESGGVAVLYAGLLILVWLPITWGSAGLTAMFIILYLIRLAFGLFAYWWIPRSVNVLERRMNQDDFTVKKAPTP